MDLQNIFGDIINDSLKIENLYDTPEILIEEPRMDILKLKNEFSNVHLNNEILIMEINKKLVFKEKCIDDLKIKLNISMNLARYYREQYQCLLKQALEDRKVNTRIAAKRKQQKI